MKTVRKGNGLFAKGNPGGPGRPKGSLSKVTLAGREMLELLERGEGDLPPAQERWKRLLTDGNPAVRLKAEMFVFCALHGTPRQAPELPSPEQDITIVVRREREPWSGVSVVRELPGATGTSNE
jgi:hypothetical protein